MKDTENGTKDDTVCETIMDGFAKRLEKGLAARGISQVQLSSRIGVARENITQMKSGKRPGRKYLASIATELGCSVEWLTTGTGPAPTWSEAVPESSDIEVLETLSELQACREILVRLADGIDQLTRQQAEHTEKLRRVEAEVCRLASRNAAPIRYAAETG